jgi:outer membrane protein TolC
LAGSIAAMEKMLAIQEQLIVKSEKKLALDQRDYNIGRLDIFYLIDAQNKLTSARLN